MSPAAPIDISTMKPLLLYGSYHIAPNPWKVIIVLEELGIPFTPVIVGRAELKAQPFESVNPNGRIPALVDPNRPGHGDDEHLTVFESGAIVEYIVDTYDPENRLHSGGDDFAARWAERQLLHFQMSGQGPYFGQAVWFAHYHPEYIDAAFRRYVNEIDRVTGVLDGMLAAKKEKKSKNKDVTGETSCYLVGNKASYADLAWLPWYWLVPTYIDKHKEGLMDKLKEKYPNFTAWYDALNERDAVKKTLAMRSDSSLMPSAKDVFGEDIDPAKDAAKEAARVKTQ